MRRESLGPRQPARLGGRAVGRRARGLPPGPIGAQPGCQGLPKASGHQERRASGRHPLRAVVAHALRPRQRTLPAPARPLAFARGGQGPPAPLGRPLQAGERGGRAALARLHRAEQGAECIALPRPLPPIVQARAGDGLPLVCRFDAPLQPRLRGTGAPPRRPPATQALGQACPHTHAACDGSGRTRKKRAEGLQQGAAPGAAPPGAPEAPVGRAGGAELAPVAPAPIGPGRGGAKVPRGVALAAAAARPAAARWGRGRGVWVGRARGCPGSAMRLGGEARKGVALTSALRHRGGSSFRCRLF